MPPTPHPWRLVVDQSNVYGPVCKVVGAVNAESLGDDIALLTTAYGRVGRFVKRDEWLANGVLMAGAREMFDAMIELIAAFDMSQPFAADQAEPVRRARELVLRLRREGGM